MNNPSIRNSIVTFIALGLIAMWWLSYGVQPPPAVSGSRPLIRKTDNHRRSVPADSFSTVAPIRPAANSAERLIARQIEWGKITDSAEADKVEIELKGQITDANAEAIVCGLSPELLETPFGLMALERWAQMDRMAAVQWLASQTMATPFQISTALRGWIVRDSDAVDQYVEGLPHSMWKEKVLAEISQDAVRNQEPLEAITLVRQMKSGPAQTRLLKDAAILWGEADPDAAAEWVGKINEPQLQENLIHMIAIGYAASRPKEAAEWLLNTLPPGKNLDQAMGDVVGVWVSKSRVEDAVAWVEQMPGGSMQESAVKNLIERWKEFNPAEASAWVQKLPPSSLQRQARSVLSSRPI